MNNKNLETALQDLANAIKSITLGSIEWVVITDAGVSLITSWNDHNSDDPIDVTAELANWEKLQRM